MSTTAVTAAEKSPDDVPYASETVGTESSRRVRLFRNGANQAVRIPKEFELPGTDAVMRRENNRLILELVPDKPKKGTAAALLLALEEIAKLGPCSDTFPDIGEEGMLPLDDIAFGND